jgi:5-methylthioadenosine/S-adenosylhomocysteine deaminase
MATIGGARVLNMDRDIGSLEPGKKADIIMLNLDHANEVPLYDYYGAIVYSIKGSDVDTSIIDGRVVMRHRRVLTLNSAEILQKTGAYRSRILASLKNKH